MAMASQQTTSKMTACNLHNARKFSVSVVGIFALLPSVVAWAGFLHNAPCVWYDDTSYSSRKTTSARTLHYCTYSSIHATSYNRRLHNRLTKLQAKEGEIEKAKEKGYQFGDISKSVVKALGTSVNKVTGKDEYQFGDISRWIDKQAKEKVNEFTNKDGEYQFGDISKEIIRRVRTGDFTLDDIVILCKVLISFGVGLQPVASFLPVKLLVEMLNYSIAADLGDKMVGAVATELDKRMKSAITGDEMYRIGDMTLRAVNKFTGKQEVRFLLFSLLLVMIFVPWFS